MIDSRSFHELLYIIRARRRFATFIAFAFVTGAIVSANMLPNRYEGRAIVSFVPRPDTSLGPANSLEVVLPKYAAYVTSPEATTEAAAQLDLDPDDLQDSTTVLIEPDSNNLEIAVIGSSSSEASDAANLLASKASQLAESDPVFVADFTARSAPAPDATFPNRPRLAGAALIVGLALGGGAAFVAERRLPRLRGPREMTAVTSFPALGAIPALRTFKRPRAAFSNPDIASGARSLRASIERTLSEGQKVITVTSPRQGGGASTVAALIAEAFARVGVSTVLVDADLKDPTLAARFRLDSDRSLSAALRGTVGVSQAVKKGWVEGLAVLTTRKDQEAGDLVVTRMPSVLEEASELYDLVVIDAPGLTSGSEATTILAYSDATVLVIRSGSSLDLVGEALMVLDSSPTPVAGIVANAVPPEEDIYA